MRVYDPNMNRKLSFAAALLLVGVLTACSEAQRSSTPSPTPEATTFECVTTLVPPRGRYGTDALGTVLYQGGTVAFARGGPGRIHTDGSLEMKWLWYRTPGTALTIEGRRLDGEAPPLEATFIDGYAGYLQVGSLIFPTAGCWEVTASTGDAVLTFTTLVVVRDEPAPTCPVTIPNASTPPGQRPFPTQHGDGDLWVVLPIDGKALVGPQRYASPLGDGAAAKFGVFRADPDAEITIGGRRLDTAAPPLEADIIEGYDGLTFQATSVRFPTLGCWEITVHGGDDTLTVVMLLEES